MSRNQVPAVCQSTMSTFSKVLLQLSLLTQGLVPVSSTSLGVQDRQMWVRRVDI